MFVIGDLMSLGGVPGVAEVAMQSGRAVAFFGRVRVRGILAWLLWLVVHLAFLTGFKTRVATLVRWIVAFLGPGRPERTITEQQVFARMGLAVRGRLSSSER
jgi:NADH:quinone reductase (non-electrogenic)